MYNPKSKFLEIQRKALLGELSILLSKIENPNLTHEQLEEVKRDVAECQRRLKEFGFKKDPGKE